MTQLKLTGKRQRRRISFVLLLTLVAGGVLSPLVHFVFMASSGLYDVPMDHHGGPGHVTMMSETSGLASNQVTALQEKADSPLRCTYADLFATFAAAEAPHQAIEVPDTSVLLLSEEGAWRDAEIVASFRSRAPPQVA